MLEFIKNLFRSEMVYGIGALEPLPDSRNIMLADIQPQTDEPIPDFYLTDMSKFGVNNQGSRPSCVGHSIAKLAEYYIYKHSGELVQLDGDKLYDMCKKEDGIPHLDGTFAAVGAKIAIRDGIDQHFKDSNDKFAVAYSFVPTDDFNSIAQAIHKNGALTIGKRIDRNWGKGIIGKILQTIGGHQTDLIGYRYYQNGEEGGYLYGINSWGTKWVGQIAGMIDKNVKPGHYVADFSDIKDSIINIIAFAPVPKKVLEELKDVGYRFLTTMRRGSRGGEVKKLQEALHISPADGVFGPNTERVVKEYQTSLGLVPDGIVGPKMREKLNEKSKSFLDQWAMAIQVHEGYFPGSKSFRNNNPGNFRWTKFVQDSLGATGKDSSSFATFPTYQAGFNALKLFLTMAATNRLRSYRGDMTLLDFTKVYAPSEDNNNPLVYSNFVAKRLGVTINTRIKDLV